MRYRGARDMQVSLYVAALVITVFGGGMTMVLVNVITSLDWIAVAAASR